MRTYRHALPSSHPFIGLFRLLPVAVLAISIPFWGHISELAQFTLHLSAWLRNNVSDHLILAYITYIFCLAAMLVLSLPLLMPSIIIAAAIFDFWEAVALVTAGRMLAATTSFAFARYCVSLTERFERHPWCMRLRNGMRREGARYVLLLRMLPLVPDSIVSYGMGITSLRWPTYLGMSFLGMLPLTVASIYLGSEFGRFTQLEFWRSFLPAPEMIAGVVAAISLFYAGMRLILRPAANPFEHQLPIGAAAYRRRLMMG